MLRAQTGSLGLRKSSADQGIALRARSHSIDSSDQQHTDCQTRPSSAISLKVRIHTARGNHMPSISLPNLRNDGDLIILAHCVAHHYGSKHCALPWLYFVCSFPSTRTMKTLADGAGWMLYFDTLCQTRQRTRLAPRVYSHHPLCGNSLQQTNQRSWDTRGDENGHYRCSLSLASWHEDK